MGGGGGGSQGKGELMTEDIAMRGVQRIREGPAHVRIKAYILVRRMRMAREREKRINGMQEGGMMEEVYIRVLVSFFSLFFARFFFFSLFVFNRKARR